MSSLAKFWIVAIEFTKTDSQPFENFESARIEAERLARLHPGKQVMVFGCEGVAKLKDVDWTKADEIPF